MKASLIAVLAAILAGAAVRPASASEPALAWGWISLPAGTTRTQCTRAAETSLRAGGFADIKVGYDLTAHASSAATLLVLCETDVRRIWILVAGDPNVSGIYDDIARYRDNLRSGIISAIPGSKLPPGQEKL